MAIRERNRLHAALHARIDIDGQGAVTLTLLGTKGFTTLVRIGTGQYRATLEQQLDPDVRVTPCSYTGQNIVAVMVNHIDDSDVDILFRSNAGALLEPVQNNLFGFFTVAMFAVLAEERV